MPRLPSFFGDEQPVPSDMEGATIISFGMPVGLEEPPEGGGLVIDYRTPEGNLIRAVFAFSDVGMRLIEHGTPARM